MFNLEKIDLTLSFNSLFFILGLILIAGYSIYVYRYTIPQVNNGFKFFLVALRTAALLLILFAIFEPILVLTKKNIIEPVNLIYVDNSKSIKAEDKTNKAANVLNFLSDAEDNGLLNNSRIFTFGSKVKGISKDSLDRISFSESTTSFSDIFNFNYDEQNISSIVIVSDGVITEGSNPVFQAEKAGIPVYTIGVGDTISKNNVEIRRVLFNEYIYSESPTVINTSISNNGFSGRDVTISLYDETNLVEQQNIKLTENNNVSFTYTPKSTGEKKLLIRVSELNGEATFADNKRIVYVDVLDNKINTLIIAGSPSPDLSFVKNALKMDANLKVSSITEIGGNKFLENVNRNAAIDSADILFLVGFPSRTTPADLINKVKQTITERNKPFFLLLAPGTDFNKLKALQSELPFSIGQINNSYSEAQPNVTPDEIDNPLLKSSSENLLQAWNNLPPVYKSNTDLPAKPESEVLSQVKIRNIPINSPLILSRNLAKKKSIAVLAKDTWRWKLQTAEKKLDLYDSFIINSVKWLNTTDEQKLVTIKPAKRLFSLGETVDFTAQVYNETFNPVDDAEININVTSGDDKYSVSMNSIGNGLYEGTLVTNKPGDYFFSGSAKQNNRVIGTDNGKFSIGDVEIEMINTSMDKELLSLLSRQTNGEFFYGNNYAALFDILKKKNELKSDVKLSHSEFALWSNEWLLIMVIILFGLEWFFRKRAGML